MRIAIVTDAVYPYNKGGKETRWFEICTRLVTMGHDVHIYCMKWWDGPNDRVENGIKLHAICPYVPLYTQSGRRSIWQGLRFGLSCLKLVWEDFDVIDIDHMPFFPVLSATLVARIRLKRVVGTWHEVWGLDYWKEYLGWKGIFGYAIERISISLPHKIISVSTATSRGLRKRFQTEARTIPLGVNVAQIRGVRPSKEVSDVIYAGRLVRHKNVDVLIKAIALVQKNRPIKCLIIGEGPERQKLETLARKLKVTDNVNFLGFLADHDNVYSYMKSSKMFVLPSTREGFGLVVIEANAAGIPVITTNNKHNASRELITEAENGYVCRLDAKEIADRIMRILREKNCVHCADSAEPFNWDKIAAEVAEVYAG